MPSVALLRQLDTVDSSLRHVLLMILEEIERQQQERVTKDEFKELKDIVGELVQAQKRTERHIEDLAQAQKRTEERLETLISEHKKTRAHLGGLSHSVGYILEDRAYIWLPQLLSQDFGLEIKGPMKRDYVIVGKAEVEINIIGLGSKNGQDVWILGEAKTQLKKRDIDAFLKKIKRVESSFPGEKFYVFVTYQASPKIRAYAKEKGIIIYYSYQFRPFMD